jgi:putative pyruvate formate lyase activating enzyme
MVSLMSQYQPYFKACEYPEISQPLTGQEYRQAVSYMKALELNGWIQGLDADEGLAGPHIQGDLKI